MFESKEAKGIKSNSTHCIALIFLHKVIKENEVDARGARSGHTVRFSDK